MDELSDAELMDTLMALIDANTDDLVVVRFDGDGQREYLIADDPGFGVLTMPGIDG